MVMDVMEDRNVCGSGRGSGCGSGRGSDNTFLQLKPNGVTPGYCKSRLEGTYFVNTSACSREVCRSAKENGECVHPPHTPARYVDKFLHARSVDEGKGR